MYLQGANVFVNVRDARTIQTNESCQVIISYPDDKTTTINCENEMSAQHILETLCKKAEEVQFR